MKRRFVNRIQPLVRLLSLIFVISAVLCLSCNQNGKDKAKNTADKKTIADDSYQSVLETECTLYDKALPDGTDTKVRVGRGEIVKVIDNEGTWPMIRLANGTTGYIEPWAMSETKEFDSYANRAEPQAGGGAEVIADQAIVFYRELTGDPDDWASLHAGFFPRHLKVEAVEKLDSGYWQIEAGGFSYFVYGSALTACDLPELKKPANVRIKNSGLAKERRRIVIETEGNLSVIEKQNSFSKNMLALEIAVTGANSWTAGDLPEIENIKLSLEKDDKERQVLYIKTDYPISGYRIVRESPGKAAVEINTNLWKNHGKSLYGVRVFIDPGHGGDEIPGYAYGAKSIEGSVHERNLALTASTELKQILEKLEAEVVIYRDKNGEFYRLSDRVEKAGEFGADIFISLHYDQAPVEWTDTDKRTKPQGAQSFFSHPQAENLAVLVGKRIHNKRKSGSERRSFDVLQQTNAVAILVELGFLTNPGELANLTDPDFRQSQLNGIAEGVVEYVSSIGG